MSTDKVNMVNKQHTKSLGSLRLQRGQCGKRLSMKSNYTLGPAWGQPQRPTCNDPGTNSPITTCND